MFRVHVVYPLNAGTLLPTRDITRNARRMLESMINGMFCRRGQWRQYARYGNVGAREVVANQVFAAIRE